MKRQYRIILNTLMLVSLPFLVFGQIGQSGTSIADLWKEYNNATTDTAKVRILCELVLNYRLVNVDSSIVLSEMVLNKIPIIKDEKLLANAYANAMYIIKAKEGIEEARKYGDKAIDIYTKLNDVELAAEASHNTGLLNHDSIGLKYLKQAYTLAQKTENNFLIVKSLLSIASFQLTYGLVEESNNTYKKLEIFFEQLDKKFYSKRIAEAHFIMYTSQADVLMGLNDYAGAFKAYIKASEIVEENDLQHYRSLAKSSLGVICEEMGLHEQAIEYSSEALKSLDPKQKQYNTSLIFILIDLGYAYKAVQNLDEALKCYDQSYKVAKETKDIPNKEIIYQYPLIGMLQVYLEKDEIQKAKEVIQEITNANILIDDTYILINYKLVLAKILLQEKRWDEALKHLKETSQLLQPFNSMQNELELARLYKRAYLGKNNAVKALEYANIVEIKGDSLRKLKKDYLSQGLAIQYEIEKKEDVIRDLQKEKELQQTKLQSQQYRVYLGILGGIVSLLLAFFLYTHNKKSKRLAKQEAALRIKEQNLFANISHEFRTPLSIMQLSLEELAESSSNASHKEQYNFISKSTNRLTELVNQVLDVSKIAEDEFRLNIVEGDPLEFLRRYTQPFATYASHKQIAFRLSIPTKSIPIGYDEEVWSKIISNLLSNAIKFTEEGQVAIHFEYLPKEVLIKVSDTGRGISKEDLPKIFDRYYQSTHEASPSFTGGLGLALTKQLVELYKGRIKVESKLGTGAVFNVYLPHYQDIKAGTLPTKFEEVEFDNHEEAVQIKAANTTSFNQPKDLSLGSDSKKKQKVLVVEDNGDLNHLISKQLSKEYQLYQAFNGAEGYEVAKNIIPDVIIVDIMMPHMDGLTLAELLKDSEATNHIPIVIISALEGEDIKNKAWKAGVVDYLSKPINFNQLRSKIANLLSKREEFRNVVQKENWFNVGQRENIDDRDAKFLEQFRSIVRENIGDVELSIQRISKDMYMSRVNVYRKVKSLTGMTPTQLMYKIKMSYAYELLKAEAGSVTEIANKVGMSNVSFFSRKFKEIYGVSPTKAFVKE